MVISKCFTVMKYNFSFSIAAFLICLILLVMMSIYHSSLNVLNRRFKFFIFTMILMVTFDIITAITIDDMFIHSVPIWLNMVLNSVYFFLGALVGIFFYLYIISLALKHSTDKVKKICYIINFSILGIYLITLIVNAFTGMYFNFDNYSYNKGPIYLLVNALTILFVIEAIVVFFIKRKEFSIRQIVSTVVFLVIFFVTFGLQLFVFPDVLLSDFGSAIGALIVYISIETPDYIKMIEINFIYQ